MAMLKVLPPRKVRACAILALALAISACKGNPTAPEPVEPASITQDSPARPLPVDKHWDVDLCDTLICPDEPVTHR